MSEVEQSRNLYQVQLVFSYSENNTMHISIHLNLPPVTLKLLFSSSWINTLSQSNVEEVPEQHVASEPPGQ